MPYSTTSLLLTAILLLCISCNKIDLTPKKNTLTEDGYTGYIIRQGNHYCDDNLFTEIETAQLKFSVVFDSSAIYQTTAPENQEDINKLFGFADNESQHHLFSARFGWRWSNNALRIFSYVYNNAELIYEEIGTVEIGINYECSITVTGANYKFRVNDTEMIMPRASTTPVAKGFKLYPYFGGDETAPHDIRIWIKE